MTEATSTRWHVGSSYWTPRRCAALLLLLWAAFAVTDELAAGFLFPRLSRVSARLEREQRAAEALRPASGSAAVLVVGNSLVERGVNLPNLQQELTDCRVRRFVVSDTSYLDWYYGLRRLYADGARPQSVVLGLSGHQLLAGRTEGDLGAHLLLRTGDVAELGRNLHADHTAVSNLYFANLSSFYGSRTQFRKWLLTELLPGIDQLGAALHPPAAALPAGPQLGALAAERLKALDELCRRNGSRFVLVIPPTPERSEEGTVEAIERAAREQGVRVLVPMRPGELDSGFFSDGFHLNERGAALFTERLGAGLRGEVSVQDAQR